MNKKKSINNILIAGALVGVLSVSGLYAVILSAADRVKTYAQENQLFIPPLIDSREVNHRIELALQHANHEFFAGNQKQYQRF